MKRWMILAAGLALPPSAHAFDWNEILKGVISQPTSQPTASNSAVDALSTTDINAGLKEALTRGADAAVAQLGQKDGFFGNAALKIPLPPSLQKAEKAMRMLGMGKQADELVVSMNRAAEAAVPEAKTLLLDAVKKMSIEDAKGIISGGNDAATTYFRKSTEAPLTVKFLPIVKKTTAKVGLAQRYNDLAGKAQRFGVVDEKQASIESYVTQMTLDGLYKMIAEQEGAIRQDPIGQGSKLIGNIFGIGK